MKIGNLEFNNNIFMAPLAGVTDVAFRLICKRMGSGLVYTEMVSAKGLYYDSNNTKDLLFIDEEEKPIAIQIFGSDPYIMAKVAEKLNEDNAISIIDINMGCPVPKIVKNGEGSALMKNPKLAASIVKEVKKAVNKPVTVKFRKGFDNSNVNGLEFAKIIEDAGADAVTVHGRTRQQMYEGKADWAIIKDIKEILTIPVIGNGDIFKAEDAIKLMEYSSCDGVMVARGALGNPWIFKQINDLLCGRSLEEPIEKERIDLCIENLRLSVKYHGEIRGVREMRKHIGWYIKGMKNSSEIKDIINRQNSLDEVIDTLLSYRKYLSISKC